MIRGLAHGRGARGEHPMAQFARRILCIGAGHVGGPTMAVIAARAIAAAARYRDDTSSIVTIDEWKAMARSMGIAKMGGPAPITPAAQR